MSKLVFPSLVFGGLSGCCRYKVRHGYSQVAMLPNSPMFSIGPLRIKASGRSFVLSYQSTPYRQLSSSLSANSSTRFILGAGLTHAHGVAEGDGPHVASVRLLSLSQRSASVAVPAGPR